MCTVLGREAGSHRVSMHQTVELWAHGTNGIRVIGLGHLWDLGGTMVVAGQVSGMVLVVRFLLKALYDGRRWLCQL